jgi:threonine dehydrogenase-like Zn-dependent dehydrogenase
MKALVKRQGKKLKLQDIPKPFVDKKGEVVIKVLMAGICRTDIYVSRGWIQDIKDNLTIGHEFMGVVEESNSDKFKKGDTVVCNPIFDNLKMLGVDYDGCFAEYIKVYDTKLYHAEGVDEKIGAYVEPIAASLAPLKSRLINKENVGAVYGNNRIGELTYEILKDAGYNVVLLDENDKSYPSNYYDYVIETFSQVEAFDEVIRILKPKGVFIAKSRNPDKIPTNFYDIVRKELIIEALYYGDFSQAVDYSLNKTYLFEKMMGNVYSLEEWEKAFKDNEKGSHKIFLKP